MQLSPKKQQGMTMISMACVAIVVVSMFLLALNIVPIYMDHGKITGALESIKHNPESRNEVPDALMSRLFKLLQVNNADNLIARENVIISRNDNGSTTINIKYEVVKKLVSNMSILVEFDDTAEIR